MHERSDTCHEGRLTLRAKGAASVARQIAPERQELRPVCQQDTIVGLLTTCTSPLSNPQHSNKVRKEHCFERDLGKGVRLNDSALKWEVGSKVVPVKVRTSFPC